MSRIKEMILDDIISKFMKSESMDELKLLFYDAYNILPNKIRNSTPYEKDIIVSVDKIRNTVFIYDIQNDLYITKDDDIENIRSLSRHIINSLEDENESKELDFRNCEVYYNTDIKNILMEYSLTKGE